MNPFSHLCELSTHLRHPAVRDLAWTLISAPLFRDISCPQRHPLAACTWSPAQLSNWLQQLDQNADSLEAWLALSSTRRLGLYFERLWQFALRAAPDVELLAANIAIRQGGHTLGEMDLLSRDANGDHHIELACKFYLGPRHASGLDPSNWLGPGAEDCLELKLEHLRQQQLPLSNTPQARSVLATLHINCVQAEVWLGGYLFYPWAAACEPPLGAHPQHLRGLWLHRGQWPEFAAQTTAGRWLVLPRPRWLAPARTDETNSLTLAQLTEHLQQTTPVPIPLLVAQLEQRADGDWHELQRLFVLHDNWPQTSNVQEALKP